MDDDDKEKNEGKGKLWPTTNIYNKYLNDLPIWQFRNGSYLQFTRIFDT